MKKNLSEKITDYAIIPILIGLFFYVASSKLGDLPTFQRSLHNQPFPDWFVRFLIPALPATEILIACLLIVGLLRYDRIKVWGLYAYLVLMSLFTLYIAAILLHFFPRVPCSCGGIIQSLSWGQH